MNDPSGWHAFRYVHADIPEGMAIGEWRRRRMAERIAARMTARAARRCRRRR
jgi:hypothetical protein